MTLKLPKVEISSSVAAFESGALSPSVENPKTQKSVFDDEDLGQFFQPVAKFEGNHRIDHEATWAPEEEKKLVRKIDFWVLPWCCLMFMCMQLDRSNINQALSDNFLDDLHLITNDYNYGQTIYYASFLTAEIPSQLVSKWIGPDRWIPIQMVLWSIVTASQCALKNKATFYATRALLGILEGGFIPDIVLYASYWYTSKELPSRLTWFWVSLQIINVIGMLLAYGILHLRGQNGWSGWAYLFLIEAMFTGVVGIISWFYLPASPYQTKGKLRGKDGWFSEREETIQANRILRDDPSKGDMHNRQAVGPKLLWKALKDYDLWPIYLLAITQFVPQGTPASYLTLTLRGLGWNTFQTNLLTIPSTVLYIINMFWINHLSIWTKEHSLVSSIAQWWSLPLLITLEYLPANTNAWAKYAVYSLLVAYPFPHPTIVSWCSRNSGSVRTRTLSTAMYNMMGNVGFIIQSNIYRTEDSPLYRTGNKVLIALCAWNIFLFLFIKAYYIWRNKTREAKWNALTKEQQVEYFRTTKDTGNKQLNFRFVH